MRKLALTALAAAIATIGLASTASADSNGDDEWRRHGHRDGGDWDGRRDRDGNDEWRHGNRHHHWRHNHRPRFVYRHHYRDDYCFVKKVRRYDDWGNVYIKRVRVCR